MHLRVEGPAAPDLVWERYARFDQWPTWSPQVRRVDVDVAVLAPGVEGVVHGPLGVAVAFRIIEVDVGARTWSWTVHPVRPALPGIDLVLDHAVRAEPDGGSSSTLDLSGPLPIVLAYGPVALLALRRLVRS